MVTTADQREINNFAALSENWWDVRGPMAPLHAFTPIRIDYILASVERFWPLKTRPSLRIVSVNWLRIYTMWRRLAY